MAELTSTFDGLLKSHDAPPTRRSFDIKRIDEFLKEAYRINTHIVNLHTQLRDVRRAYLSTAQPRKTQLRSARAEQRQEAFLTDQQREEIDADAKRLLRDLNASIRSLSEAEELHQSTQQALLRKRFAASLSAMLAGLTANPEREAAEKALQQVAAHREGVLWYLRQRLQECGQLQQSMMEIRLTREMEKNRSVLAKAQLDAQWSASAEASAAGFSSPTAAGAGSKGPSAAHLDEEDERRRRSVRDGLTDEQVQMFEKDNQDMLKHYESTLDKVKTAEKSLVEISELQTLLVNNLEIQASHIEQLVADSLSTAENVDKGNKELKKALERPSTAKYTFFAASGLCLFVIVWDLLI